MYPRERGARPAQAWLPGPPPWRGLCPPCLPHPPLALLGLLLPAAELLTLPCSLLLSLALLLRSRCQLLHLPLHQCPVMRAAEPQALGEESEGEGKRPRTTPGSLCSRGTLSGAPPALSEVKPPPPTIAEGSELSGQEFRMGVGWERGGWRVPGPLPVPLPIILGSHSSTQDFSLGTPLPLP